jgi:hypothetical protein
MGETSPFMAPGPLGVGFMPTVSKLLYQMGTEYVKSRQG